MALFKRAPIRPRTPPPRRDELDQMGLVLTEAFTKPEDEDWASFNSQVAGLVAKLDVPLFKG